MSSLCLHIVRYVTDIQRVDGNYFTMDAHVMLARFENPDSLRSPYLEAGATA